MIYGIDSLALPKYWKVIKDELPSGWWFSSFAETFGDAYKAVHEVLRTNRAGGVRMQLIWSDTHSFGDKDIPKITQLSKRYEVLAKQYPSVTFELSPFCEHNLKNPDKYLDIVKANAPSCIPVNTIWQGALSKKYKNEIHGNKANALKKNYNFSYDGQNTFDADITSDKEKYFTSSVFFLWSPQCNGKMKLEDKTPRPERKAWLDNKQCEALIYQSRAKGETSLPNRWIFKSMSDQHTVPPTGKDCKCVLISPLKLPEFKLVCENGQVVDTLKYYGTFTGGGYRYYTTQWGYDLAEKANRIQRNPVCKLVSAGKVYGSINPAFRENNDR